MKNCLASWLHSAETEAIACGSKVIGGRIYDACRCISSSADTSRKLRTIAAGCESTASRFSRWSNLGANCRERLPKSCRMGEMTIQKAG
jgi:hypothetical protein